jgi:hypothetical protein
MSPQTERTVTSLLLDAAYGVEHREALGMLKEDVGHVVEADRLIHLVEKRFPDIAAHPQFRKEASACIDIVVPMLGLEPWEDAWFVTRSGTVRLGAVRRDLDAASPAVQRRILQAIGPSLRRPTALAAALVRTMPDLSRDATHRALVARLYAAGGVSVDRASSSAASRSRAGLRETVPPAEPSKQRSQSAAPRRTSWRPGWWPRLREWSAERGFKLKRLDAPEGSVTQQYLDRVASLLASDEVLAVAHWRTGFSTLTAMTDVERIEVHAHLVHQAMKRIRVSKKQDPDTAPPRYSELIKQAFFLGLDDNVVDVALARRFQRTGTISLRRDMRIKPSLGPGRQLDEVLEVHDEVERHAKALRMSFDSNVSRATDVVAVTHWSLRSTAVTKAIRYRIPIVLIDDFLAAGMRDELESRLFAFSAQRAAICGRCGIVHAFSARRVHRKDLLCPACR